MNWLDAQRTINPIGSFATDPVTRALLIFAYLMVAMFFVLLLPWLWEGRLVEGVNAWTKENGCASGSPDGFTQVDYFFTFINETIVNNP